MHIEVVAYHFPYFVSVDGFDCDPPMLEHEFNIISVDRSPTICPANHTDIEIGDNLCGLIHLLLHAEASKRIFIVIDLLIFCPSRQRQVHLFIFGGGAEVMNC